MQKYNRFTVTQSFSLNVGPKVTDVDTLELVLFMCLDASTRNMPSNITQNVCQQMCELPRISCKLYIAKKPESLQYISVAIADSMGLALWLECI